MTVDLQLGFSTEDNSEETQKHHQRLEGDVSCLPSSYSSKQKTHEPSLQVVNISTAEYRLQKAKAKLKRFTFEQSCAETEMQKQALAPLHEILFVFKN